MPNQIDVVYALTSASITLPDGGMAIVRTGQHWPANDPVVLAQPSLFTADPRVGMTFSVEPAEAASERGAGVEQATAAPGERRSARRG